MHHRMVVHSGFECSKDNFMFLVHKWYLTNVPIIHLSDNESLGRFRKKVLPWFALVWQSQETLGRSAFKKHKGQFFVHYDPNFLANRSIHLL